VQKGQAFPRGSTTVDLAGATRNKVPRIQRLIRSLSGIERLGPSGPVGCSREMPMTCRSGRQGVRDASKKAATGRGAHRVAGGCHIEHALPQAEVLFPVEALQLQGGRKGQALFVRSSRGDRRVQSTGPLIRRARAITFDVHEKSEGFSGSNSPELHASEPTICPAEEQHWHGVPNDMRGGVGRAESPSIWPQTDRPSPKIMGCQPDPTSGPACESAAQSTNIETRSAVPTAAIVLRAASTSGTSSAWICAGPRAVRI